MKKDSIDNSALEKAYLIYSEHGHKTVDYEYSHKSTDYKRGTVEEPEHVSNIDGRYAESPEFEAQLSRMEGVNAEVASLEEKMKTCRQRGNFGDLQVCMKKMASLMKQKESIDAKMAVENLGAAQMAVYNRTMDQDERFSEMTAMGERIAALEARILEFVEAE